VELCEVVLVLDETEREEVVKLKEVVEIEEVVELEEVTELVGVVVLLDIVVSTDVSKEVKCVVDVELDARADVDDVVLEKLRGTKDPSNC
jgi:hypothetical protein